METQHNLGKLNTNAKAVKNDEYYTPREVLHTMTRTFGGKFVYDPASNKGSADYLCIEDYDDINTNGLTKDWSTKQGDIWINPPFTLKKEFINKAVETIKNGFQHDIFILVPDKSITNKYMWVLEDISWDLVIPNGRIAFIDKDYNPTKGNFFGSVILRLKKDGGKNIHQVEIM